MRNWLLIGLILLSGCSLTWQEVALERKIGKSYEFLEIYMVTTGSPILRVENLYLRPSFTPAFEYQPPYAGINAMPKLIPGQKWIAFYTTYEYGKKGFVIQCSEYSKSIGIHISPDGTVGSGWINPPATIVIQAENKWTKEPLFVKTESVTEEGSFAAELIYSGLSQDTIRISYREFSGDLARPAFYQELIYDLSESKRITFRSIVLEIIEATNSSLTFKVIADNGLPWMPK